MLRGIIMDHDWLCIVCCWGTSPSIHLYRPFQGENMQTPRRENPKARKRTQNLLAASQQCYLLDHSSALQVVHEADKRKLSGSNESGQTKYNKRCLQWGCGIRIEPNSLLVCVFPSKCSWVTSWHTSLSFSFMANTSWFLWLAKASLKLPLEKRAEPRFPWALHSPDWSPVGGTFITNCFPLQNLPLPPPPPYLRSWSPPGPAACTPYSSPCCLKTSRRSSGPRRRIHAASASTCRSSAPPPALQRRRRGNRGSGVPGQWRTPPRRGFCPASSSGAAGRWAQGNLSRGTFKEISLTHKIELTLTSRSSAGETTPATTRSSTGRRCRVPRHACAFAALAGLSSIPKKTRFHPAGAEGQKNMIYLPVRACGQLWLSALFIFLGCQTT